jgi:hypothetical protein
MRADPDDNPHAQAFLKGHQDTTTGHDVPGCTLGDREVERAI